MNKNKLLIYVCLAFFISSFPIYTFAKCTAPRPAKLYVVTLTADAFSPSARLALKLTRTSPTTYETEFVNLDTSERFTEGRLTQDCRIIFTIIPVDVDVDGVTAELNYKCTGTITKRRSISGSCVSNDFIPGLGTTITDEGFFKMEPRR